MVATTSQNLSSIGYHSSEKSQFFCCGVTWFKLSGLISVLQTVARRFVHRWKRQHGRIQRRRTYIAHVEKYGERGRCTQERSELNTKTKSSCNIFWKHLILIVIGALWILARNFSTKKNALAHIQNNLFSVGDLFEVPDSSGKTEKSRFLEHVTKVFYKILWACRTFCEQRCPVFWVV